MNTRSMDYEQLYRTDSESKTSPTSNRNTFDQFTDYNQWSPEVFTSGDSPNQTYSKSSFQTSTTDYKTALKGNSDWVGAVEGSKSVPSRKPEQLSLSEQMRKFSNRYLFETVQCSRYDLMSDYFNKEKPISEMLKTPHALSKPTKKKEPPSNNRHILVQHPEKLKRKDTYDRIDSVKKQHTTRITCTIDGTPWKPKSLLDRSECNWYRKHRLNTQMEPVKRYKQPNLMQPSNLVRLSKVGRRDTNSFFKPVL